MIPPETLEALKRADVTDLTFRLKNLATAVLDGKSDLYACHSAGLIDLATWHHHAATGPRNVLALIAEIERVTAERSQLDAECDEQLQTLEQLQHRVNTTTQVLADERDTLRAENATLRSKLEEAEEAIEGVIKDIKADESTIRAFMDPEHCSSAECNMGRILLDVCLPKLAAALSKEGSE